MRFAPYVPYGSRPYTAFYYKKDEDGNKQLYTRDSSGEEVEVEIIPSSLNLPYLLRNSKYKRAETIISTVEKIK
ncbi:MAG: hypothetical protein Nk1A_8140 [Endomicrobiia bacterium]|nr:MAG: hypothetical protein Nk1A_8140 [Endomicrobiia bacterium]